MVFFFMGVSSFFDGIQQRLTQQVNFVNVFWEVVDNMLNRGRS